MERNVANGLPVGILYILVCWSWICREVSHSFTWCNSNVKRSPKVWYLGWTTPIALIPFTKWFGKFPAGLWPVTTVLKRGALTDTLTNILTIHTFHILNTLTLLHTIIVYSQEFDNQLDRVSPTLETLSIGFKKLSPKTFGQIVGIHQFCRTLDNHKIPIGILFLVINMRPEEVMLDTEILGARWQSLIVCQQVCSLVIFKHCAMNSWLDIVW